MTKRFARGLVVGKFCPLHRGHEFVINEAIRQCEEVVVISYSKPEFEKCGRANRDLWIADRFPGVTRLVVDDDALGDICVAESLIPMSVPHNDAPDEEHRRFIARLCLEILGETVDAVFTSESYGDGFAEALTHHFCSHVAEAASVSHVCVDKPRKANPVSGTAIRSDPHAHRSFLAPTVYAGFVSRVALLGAESSGKTTLAEALAKHFDTVWVPEYGRELWEAQNGHLNLADMIQIGVQQVQIEQRLASTAHKWLFCDTTPLTTVFYSQAMFGVVDPELRALAKRRYDYVILCSPDFGFVQDGTRQTAAFQEKQHCWYMETLKESGLHFVIASGSLAERVAQIVSLLQVTQSNADTGVCPDRS
jgi:HTH-type transcriptional regulator, transcriptional repressor of NAD biosynthesis genes